MSARRRAVPPDRARLAAEAAARHLAAAPELLGRGRIALYAALPGELPTEPLYRVALQAGSRILWPRIARTGHLEFAASQRREDLRPGRYGVPAPPPEVPAEALGGDVLILAPGLAFDRRGHRLGRGGGHYDRALAEAAGAVCLGVGFEFQVIEDVPLEEGDRLVDGLLTDQGLLRIRRGVGA